MEQRLVTSGCASMRSSTTRPARNSDQGAEQPRNPGTARIYPGFLGHFNIIAKLVPQIRKALVMRCWKDGEHTAGIARQHDCLGQSIPRRCGRADAMVGSCGITSSAFKYRWCGPPLRLASLASLALTAPREEISREICRIAVAFRRAGLSLWRNLDLARPPSENDARWHDRAPAERPRDRRRTAANRSPAGPQQSTPKRPWQMDFLSQPAATSGLRLSRSRADRASTERTQH